MSIGLGEALSFLHNGYAEWQRERWAYFPQPGVKSEDWDITLKAEVKFPSIRAWEVFTGI